MLNTIFPSMPRSPEWHLLFRFSSQNIVCIFHISHTCYMPRLSHLPFLITLIIFGDVYKLRSSSLCCLLHPTATSCLLCPKFSSAPCSQSTYHVSLVEECLNICDKNKIVHSIKLLECRFIYTTYQITGPQR